MYVISGFFREVDEIHALLGYYAAYAGNSLPTFRDNLSVGSSRVTKSNILFTPCLVYGTETWLLSGG
jgi:hypothetical protein